MRCVRRAWASSRRFPKGHRQVRQAGGVIAVADSRHESVRHVTPIGTAIYAIKCKDAVIFAPHPAQPEDDESRPSASCAPRSPPPGRPKIVLQCVERPSIPLANELMSICDLTIATGGHEGAHVPHAGRGHRLPDLVALVRVPAERLLANHVLACLGRSDRRLRVQRVGPAVVEEADPLVRDQIPPLGGRVLPAVAARGLTDGVLVAACDPDQLRLRAAAGR